MLSASYAGCLQQPGYTARPRPEPPDARHAEFRAQLLALIERLDDLEQIEPGWRGGQVAARLQLLAAKKRLLRALALLDSAREE